MDRADAPRLCVRGKFEIHSGIIDRTDNIRLPLADRPLHRLLDAEKIENLLEHLSNAHHCKVVDPEAVVSIAADLGLRPTPQDLRANLIRIENTRFLAS